VPSEKLVDRPVGILKKLLVKMLAGDVVPIVYKANDLVVILKLLSAEVIRKNN
jgi:hypothetical protein